MPATLLVQSTRADNRVVLFERHSAHPGGEAFVAAPGPVEVGDTPLVRYKIASGQLALLATPEPPQRSKAEK
jgi:hypothetical protein